MFIFHQDSPMILRSCLACYVAILASSSVICRRLEWVVHGVTSCLLVSGAGRFSRSEGKIQPCSIETEAETEHQSQLSDRSRE